MSRPPTPSESAILSRVGERSFRLGKEYFESGAVFDGRLEGAVLKARCQGSSGGPYRITIKLSKQGVEEADCSCPVGDGGHCKHVAAVLLTWRKRPEEFAEVEAVEQSLERRSKEELIALIKQMLRREPELESLLAAPLPGRTGGKPAAPEVYRRQAQAVFRNADDRWGAESDIADQLSAIKETGDDFLAQNDPASAAAVFQGVSSAVLAQYETFNDEEGELLGVVASCVEGLGNCLVGVKEEHKSLRETILRALFEIYHFDVGFGGVGMSDEVPDLILEHALADERRLVAGWIRKRMPSGKEWSDNWQRQAYGGFLMELEQDSLDDEAFLRVARETGRVYDVVDRLLKLGRIDEAIGDAEKADDYDLLGLADLFVSHGHADAAEGLILKRSRTSKDIRLVLWLRERAIARHDDAAALKLSEQLFRAQPSLEEYEQIKELASRVGRWEAWRKQLLAALKAMNRPDLLIQVYLSEKQIDEALKALKAARGAWWGGGMELAVAEAAEKTHPRESLAIYRKRAEKLIELRGRESYREACTFLKKVKSLHAQLGEAAEWETLIAELREKNRSLRALLEELNKAKL